MKINLKTVIMTFLITALLIVFYTIPIQAQSTPPAGHAWQSPVIVEATCEQDGYIQYTCSACPLTYRINIPALGHDLTIVVTQPTCTEDGSRVTTCSRGDHSYTESIPALGHDLSTVVTQPTCTEDGSRVTTCSRGDHFYTESIPALGHAFSTMTTPATETKNGNIITTCSHCDFTDNKILAKREPQVEQSQTQPPTTSFTSFTNTSPIDGYAANISQLSTSVTSYINDTINRILDLPIKTFIQLSSFGNINALDAVLGTLSLGVITVSSVILYPYISVFKWIHKQKKAAIHRIFGGKS